MSVNSRDRTDEAIEAVNDVRESMRELSEQIDSYIQSELTNLPYDEDKPGFDDVIDGWVTEWK